MAQHALTMVANTTSEMTSEMAQHAEMAQYDLREHPVRPEMTSEMAQYALTPRCFKRPQHCRKSAPSCLGAPPRGATKR
eukprot:9497176-Pyramimonas_sp.AAC.1